MRLKRFPSSNLVDTKALLHVQERYWTSGEAVRKGHAGQKSEVKLLRGHESTQGLHRTSYFRDLQYHYYKGRPSLLGLEAIAIRVGGHGYLGWRPSLLGLEAIATRLEPIAIRLEAMAIRLEAMVIRLQAIAC